MTDPIGDLLIRIKNAYLAKQKSLVVPYSRFKTDLAHLLVKEGYVEKAQIEGKAVAEKIIRIDLKYYGRRGAMNGVKRISKPGVRIYVKTGQTREYRRHAYGLGIVSTSKGLMSDKEAGKKGLGGELICEIW